MLFLLFQVHTIPAFMTSLTIARKTKFAQTREMDLIIVLHLNAVSLVLCHITLSHVKARSVPSDDFYPPQCSLLTTTDYQQSTINF